MITRDKVSEIRKYLSDGVEYDDAYQFATEVVPGLIDQMDELLDLIEKLSD